MVLQYPSTVEKYRASRRARWTKRNWTEPRWRIVGCDADYLTRTETVFEYADTLLALKARTR